MSCGLGVALAWGVEPVFLNLALSTYPSSFVAFARFFVVFLGFALFFLFRNSMALKIFARPPRLAFVAALFLLGNYYGFIHGISLVGPAVAAVVVQIGVLFLAVLGPLLFRERPTVKQVFGVLLAGVGFFLFYYDRKSFYPGQELFSEGELWLIVSGVSWSCYAACQKHLSQRYAPQHLNMLIIGFASAFFLPSFSIRILSSGGSPELLFLFIACVLNLVSFVFLAEALRRIPAALVSLFVLLSPCVTLGLSELDQNLELGWLPREQVDVLGYFGVALVVFGLFFTALPSPVPPSQKFSRRDMK